MGIYSDNFWTAVYGGNKVSVAQDSSDKFDEEKHPRNKEGKGGGQFRTKPETIAKQDDLSDSDLKKEGAHRNDDSSEDVSEIVEKFSGTDEKKKCTAELEQDGEGGALLHLDYDNLKWWGGSKGVDSPPEPAGFKEFREDELLDDDLKELKRMLAEQGFDLSWDDEALKKAIKEGNKIDKNYLVENGYPKEGSITLPCKVSRKASPKSEKSDRGGAEEKIKFIDATPEQYAETIASAKKDCSSADAWRVDAYPAEHYKDAKARIVTEKGSCIAVMPNGDMVSLCRSKKEADHIRGMHLMAEAIRRGGDRCDSFDGNWRRYIKSGMTPVSWTPWNPEYKPSDWKEGVNSPEDVIFFMHTGKTDPIDMTQWKAEHKPFTGESGYDDAMKARDAALEEFKKRK